MRAAETSVPGVFAAGDCTVVPYKQIVIAMGEGAKASLERVRPPDPRAACRALQRRDTERQCRAPVRVQSERIGVVERFYAFSRTAHETVRRRGDRERGQPQTEIPAAARLSELGFPEGLVEAGEEPIDAAVREVREETTLDDISFDWGLVFMDTGPYNKGKISRYYIARSKETHICCR